MSPPSSPADVVAPGDRPIYWDWNATTPPHPEVLAAMQKAHAHAWANPSSPHQAGRAARALIEDVRERIAALLALDARDVLFTGSGTEANNLALRSATALVVSRIDHPSIVRVAEARSAAGVPVLWVPVPASGCLEPEQVLRVALELPTAVRPGAVVALTAANHETGVIQDVVGVGARLREHGIRLHVDAAQALGKLPLERFLGADSYTLVAHKIRGPQGVAALAWRGAAPAPVLLGGSQERGLRPGTQSAPLIAGWGAALQRLEPQRYLRLQPLRDRLERELAGVASVNGEGAPRLTHVSNLSFTGWSGERLVAALDVRGLCVSTGSACRVGTAEPSAAVLAMLGVERARGAVRISLGEDCDESELGKGIDLILQLLRSQSSGASGAPRGIA
ncbi:MAG TPA: cysteine desulfurase family protein [Polyangiaceae bacterium]|nr:cysteine desulfurase family protein [Polyangiaceae bacterium]